MYFPFIFVTDFWLVTLWSESTFRLISVVLWFPRLALLPGVVLGCRPWTFWKICREVRSAIWYTAPYMLVRNCWLIRDYWALYCLLLVFCLWTFEGSGAGWQRGGEEEWGEEMGYRRGGRKGGRLTVECPAVTVGYSSSVFPVFPALLFVGHTFGCVVSWWISPHSVCDVSIAPKSAFYHVRGHPVILWLLFTWLIILRSFTCSLRL